MSIVNYDNSASGISSTSGLTATWSHTNAGNIIWVAAQDDNGAYTVTGVTYAGVALTRLSATHLYYLVNPALGVNNVIVTRSGTTNKVGGLSSSYTMVKPTGIPDASTTNSLGSNGTTMTTSLTSLHDRCWFILFAQTGNGGQTFTASTGSTLRQQLTMAEQIGFFDSNGEKTPAGSYSMTVNWTNPDTPGTTMVSFGPYISVSDSTSSGTDLSASAVFGSFTVGDTQGSSDNAIIKSGWGNQQKNSASTWTNQNES